MKKFIKLFAAISLCFCFPLLAYASQTISQKPVFYDKEQHCCYQYKECHWARYYYNAYCVSCNHGKETKSECYDDTKSAYQIASVFEKQGYHCDLHPGFLRSYHNYYCVWKPMCVPDCIYW